MTGQDLLDTMEIVYPELQLQPGEADVRRGLLALNVAQDYFEVLLANIPNALGGTVGSVTATGGVETTAFPTGLLRIDRLQYLDPNTSYPRHWLINESAVGGHTHNRAFPLAGSSQQGVPRTYFTNGTNIYWGPTPASDCTIRYYGLVAKTDITASGTFLYPDVARLPMAIFAAQLLKMGLDDPTTELDAMAASVFQPVLKTFHRFNRDGSLSFTYASAHDA